jgi:hypothetical protein
MKKLSARDIELFVAGAISVVGFRALFWLFYDLFTARDFGMVFSHLTLGLALPLGIGIFIGRTRAILWARIFIWLWVIGGFTSIPLYCYLVPSQAVHTMWKEGPDMLVSIILLGLIIWSRSQRLRQEPAA